MQRVEEEAGPAQQGPWPNGHLADSGAGATHKAPHDHLGQGQGLADQLLAAQLHALQLSSTAFPHAHGYPLPPGPPLGVVHPPPGGGSGAMPGSAGPNGAPQQLDPSILNGDLFSRLHMGGGSNGVLLPAGLPPSAAMAAHQQQQQQQQRPPGKRRPAAGNRKNEEKVRRTVYISDISDAVSEAQLAAFFQSCGQLVDCRVCGDPNSSMRFAFIEFMTEEAAQQALSKSGSQLGDFPIRVSPSKTAIVPVNNTYLPRSNEERELVARTVFVGNIDRVVEREQLRDFFENLCGPVSKIRLLGDTQHNSKIAFVEFATAESARAALKLSGALLGTLPLRVSPSKTPVRVDSRRNQEVRAAMPQPGVPAPQTPAGHPSPLPPALLMAVAGLHLPYATHLSMQ